MILREGLAIGLDNLEKMAQMDTETVLKITREFVEDSGFEGIAPLPAEVKYSIETAKKLPKIIDY